MRSCGSVCIDLCLSVYRTYRISLFRFIIVTPRYASRLLFVARWISCTGVFCALCTRGPEPWLKQDSHKMNRVWQMLGCDRAAPRQLRSREPISRRPPAQMISRPTTLCIAFPTPPRALVLRMMNLAQILGCTPLELLTRVLGFIFVRNVLIFQQV